MADAGEQVDVAFWCDARGTLLQVVRDDAGVLAERLGDPARLAFDPLSRRKFDRLVAALFEGEAVHDWRLNLTLAGRVRVLVFAGGREGDRALLIGSESAALTAPFFEELARDRGPNGTQVRRLVDGLTHPAATAEPGLSEARLDDFTRLTNELVTAQRELARRNAELARLGELKNRFLGMAAHDLRNPLGAISGFSKLLLHGVCGELAPQQADLIRKIESSSAFMLALVEELLDVSLMESGNLRLARVETDLAALVHETLALHQPHAQSKSTQLIPELLGDLSAIWIDERKIEQVLSNLVSNAIKYSAPGSRVWVRATAEPHGRVRVEVQDEGPGIPAQELERLFRPFETTSVRSTGGEKSTGLGLVIVQRIVEGHGGRIEVESEVGKGSIFRAELAGARPADSA